MVITEFDAGDPEATLAFATFGGTSVPANRTLHALADEILKYRQALWLLATAIGWASAGTPFGLFPPGPFGRPRRTINGTPEMPDAPPPAV